MCEVRDLKPNGANILVTEENKKEYVHLVCQMKMTGELWFRSHFTLINRMCISSDLMSPRRACRSDSQTARGLS